MKTVLIEAHYLPSIAYFVAIHKAQEIILEKHEYFVKQSYRNRCYLQTSQGTASLIVPVTDKQGKAPISDVRIDYDQKWLNNHWRTIRSAYAKAPFYEHYADDLEKVLFRKHAFLFDLNQALLSMCLGWLRWSLPVKESLAYTKSYESTVIDLRSVINPKKTDFLADLYRPVPYSQVFGNPFAGNMSLIDLIFCEGPQAAAIVQASSLEK